MGETGRPSPERPSDDEAAVFRYPEAAPESEANGLPGALDPGAAGGREDLARAAAVREGEERARAWYAGELERERRMLVAALQEFAGQREAYFRAVEREAVQLSLRIAGKVLEREACANPLAVAAMVHVALASLQSGTAVTLRVHPAAAQDWRLYFAAREGASGVFPTLAASALPSVVEDPSLAPGDCVVATAMGTVEISLGHKLREIEASFLELLAQRPGTSA